MSDKEMLLFLYGVLRAIGTKKEIIEKLEMHLWPPGPQAVIVVETIDKPQERP